ncbi:MAG: hypothetical protein ACFCVG_02270 [Kineosporiaceae bacterium]
MSGELWLSPSAFASAWVLDDVRRALVEGGEAKPVSDAATEFEEFLSDVG